MSRRAEQARRRAAGDQSGVIRRPLTDAELTAAIERETPTCAHGRSIFHVPGCSDCADENGETE